MTRAGGPGAVHTAGPGGREPAPSAGDPRVAANERLTTLTGAVLLVLIVGELATTATLHTLLSAHVFVGVLLVGPLAVKLGSTGYRFARYYRGAPAFVRKGAPRRALRVLAPLLVATTLVLIGSGIGLLVTGPTDPGALLALHNISAVFWLPLIAIHAVAYVRRLPRLIVDAGWGQATRPAPGHGRRLGVNLGALLAGGIAALLVLPTAPPWSAWIETGQRVPAPLIVGAVAAALALLAARPLRWG